LPRTIATLDAREVLSRSTPLLSLKTRLLSVKTTFLYPKECLLYALEPLLSGEDLPLSVKERLLYGEGRPL
jgi:hypothetical protein